MLSDLPTRAITYSCIIFLQHHFSRRIAQHNLYIELWSPEKFSPRHRSRVLPLAIFSIFEKRLCVRIFFFLKLLLFVRVSCYLPCHDTVTQVCSQVHDCLITPIRHTNELTGIAGISRSQAQLGSVTWSGTRHRGKYEPRASSKRHLVLQSNNSSRLQVHEPIFLMNY